MDRETLYKFFEGAASYEEEVRIRQWMEHSPENRRKFLKERKIFDSMLLLGDEKTIEEKMRHKSWSLSSLGTELIKIAAAVAVTLGLSLLYQFVSDKNGVVPMQSIYVPTGQRVNITLSDGRKCASCLPYRSGGYIDVEAGQQSLPAKGRQAESHSG